MVVWTSRAGIVMSAPLVFLKQMLLQSETGIQSGGGDAWSRA